MRPALILFAIATIAFASPVPNEAVEDDLAVPSTEDNMALIDAYDAEHGIKDIKDKVKAKVGEDNWQNIKDGAKVCIAKMVNATNCHIQSALSK